jgi:hypothetical protein
MGQARWAGTETARKSPALERPSTKAIVPRAGTARWSDRAWAAFSARWPGTGHDTISGQPDAARRPANSPRIRRINTDENPNSLLLPLPQPPTPPPPSLVNVSAAPLPPLILASTLPPSPRRHASARPPLHQEQAQPPPLPPSILTAPRTPAAVRWAHPGTTAGRRDRRRGQAPPRADGIYCTAARRHQRSAGSAPPRGASPSEKS